MPKWATVKEVIQEQIEIAYRTAYENAARVAEDVRENQTERDSDEAPEGSDLYYDLLDLGRTVDHHCDRIAERIRALPIPTVTVIRPETAALHPEKVTKHTIIAGQGLHPVTDEIIDRSTLQRVGAGIAVTSNGTVLMDVKRCP